WKNGKANCNSLNHETYLKTRTEAALRGVKAILYWNGKPVTVGEYLKLLILSYKDEASTLEIPHSVFEVIDFLEKGLNHAEAIRYAVVKSKEEFKRSWEKDIAAKLASAMKILLYGNSLNNYYKALGL
ncbi:MAG: hypothetical protein RMI79_00005, partial [Nitrososphaerota archaeon]|nr:hypothetical protein [Nitrososphaerota archaeon]